MTSLERILFVGQKADAIVLRALSRGVQPSLAQLMRYHFEVGGKRMRAAIVILACGAAGGKVSEAIRPAAVVEMIHNYSLVMDDMIDHGVKRRGRPTARVVFGDNTSLLVAMYYREVLDEIIEKCVRGSAIRRVAVRAMKSIIDGERLDLLLQQAGTEEPYLVRNRLKKPSFGQYLKMIGKKTAALFKAASEIGGIAAGASEVVVDELRDFGWRAGLAFQIVDDVLDIVGDDTGKQRGKDIVEHKLGNAVILTAMRYLNHAERNTLLNILRSDHASAKMVKTAVGIVSKTPAEAACREVANVYLEEAKRRLQALSESTYKESLLSLCDLIVERSF